MRPGGLWLRTEPLLDVRRTDWLRGPIDRRQSSRRWAVESKENDWNRNKAIPIPYRPEWLLFGVSHSVRRPLARPLPRGPELDTK